LGYLADEGIQKAIYWITTYQRFDDGVNKLPKDWPYNQLNGGCWGKLYRITRGAVCLK